MWRELLAALHTTYRITPRALVAVLLAWMLILTASCALIFRWTTMDPRDTAYSRPLRTRPATQ